MRSAFAERTRNYLLFFVSEVINMRPQVLAFLCEDQTMAITSLLFLAFFAAVALINYALPRVLRPYFLLL